MSFLRGRLCLKKNIFLIEELFEKMFVKYVLII